MKDKENIVSQLESDIDKLMAKKIFNPAYRRKRLILWSIRTAATIVLYLLFWEHQWVRWSLIVVAPLSLFTLFMITIMPWFMQRKIKKIRHKINSV